jgi:uncharacterized protein YegP (UPF0339 family)
MSDTTRAEVFPAADGWRFRLVAKGNSAIVAQSEGYKWKGDAWHEAAQIVGDDDVREVNAKVEDARKG